MVVCSLYGGDCMWIYEHANWTDFYWDSDALLPLLTHVRHAQGKLLGRMQSLGFDLQSEATLHALTHDTVKSYAIEGENLDTTEVRSSIARRLGLDTGGDTHTNRNVDGIVDVLLDATQNYTAPLTKDRLYNWHAGLFPTGRSGIQPITVGAWRPPQSDPMQVISGGAGRTKIHFQAPLAHTLENAMTVFLKWYNSKDCNDPIIKAGIAHLWFLTLHPFEDGNGRLGRAISDMILAQADNTPKRFYSMSHQIQKDRKAYYSALEKQQRNTPDITTWLQWYIQCLGKAIDTAHTTTHAVMFKSKVWESLQDKPINHRQKMVLNRMLESDFIGYINSSKYAKLAKCSPDTALRDIKALQNWGVLIQNTARGRSTSYRIKGKDKNTD